MNNEINTEQLEKLKALRAEQKRIEEQLKIQEKISKNDAKKAEAVKDAEQRRDGKIKANQKLNGVTREFFKELHAINSAVTLTEKTVKGNTVTPYAYLTNENGESEIWNGKDIKYETKELTIKYKSIKIEVLEKDTSRSIYHSKKSWQMRIPEKVTGYWGKTYKRAKTIIEKIDVYDNEVQRKANQAKAEERALKDAVTHLKKITPESTVIEKSTAGTHYGHHRHRNWVEWNELKVTLPNENTITYKVSASTTEKDEPTFELILKDFKDNRIESLKKDPTQLVNHLK